MKTKTHPDARFVDKINPDWVSDIGDDDYAAVLVTVPGGETVVIDTDPKTKTKDRIKVSGPATISAVHAKTKGRQQMTVNELDAKTADATSQRIADKLLVEEKDVAVLRALGLSDRVARKVAALGR